MHHSGKVRNEEVQIIKDNRTTSIKRDKQAGKKNNTVRTQQFIKIVVKNAANNMEEIGQVSVELDELIDTNLKDLAKEYCVCLNRTDVLNGQFKDELAKANEKKHKEIKQRRMRTTEFSGIIRFLTIFKPTTDTSLRFMQTRRNKKLDIPKQLLHFEYLQEKSDFDTFKFKIPQVSFNPNLKGIGEEMVDLQNLIT